MIKRYFLILLLLFAAVAGVLTSGVPATPPPVSALVYERSLQSLLDKIKALPQVEQLIAQATEEGAVSIKVDGNYSSQFEGYWSSSDRTIILAAKHNTTEGKQICTLLFELHNAARNKDFRELDRQALAGEISKGEYVEGVEYIEYENAVAVSALLDQGIEQGLFPADSAWHPHRTFEQHFNLQRSSGHSDWIAKNYDLLFDE